MVVGGLDCFFFDFFRFVYVSEYIYGIVDSSSGATYIFLMPVFASEEA